jgi:hypothetical protein
MGQFLQINGDYNIKTKIGSKIVLDTGTAVGEDSSVSYPGNIEIIGNLNVKGTTTTVSSSNLEIVDRILTLNKGEVGPGVTQVYSGIEIDRGTGFDSTLANRAAFLFNENDIPQVGSEQGSWIIAFGDGTGSYSFRDSNLKLRRILTDAGTDGGNLTLIATGTGVVSVAGTIDYEQQVENFGDDALTNKKYVDDAILNNPTFQIRAPQNEDTRVIIADSDVQIPSGTPGSLAYQFNETGFTNKLGNSAVSIIVDGNRTAQFYSAEIILQDILIENNEIRSENGDIDVFVKTPTNPSTGALTGTSNLRINRGFRMDNIIGNNPGPENNSSILYSKPRKIGNTGVYFVSNDTTLGTSEDELISKSRALVFSILF